jgi:hypothetical protein
MKPYFLLAGILVLGMGCGNQNARNIESTGPVTVRSTRWGGRRDYSSMVVEYDNGQIKLFDRICDDAVAAWPGLRANISFRWNSSRECYDIEAVQRVSFGAQ